MHTHTLKFSGIKPKCTKIQNLDLNLLHLASVLLKVIRIRTSTRKHSANLLKPQSCPLDLPVRIYTSSYRYSIYCTYGVIIEGSLEVKLPTIFMDRWKSRGGESQRSEEKSRREKIREIQRRERVRRKKMPRARKGRKVAIHCVSPMICGSRRSKSWLAKAAGAELSGQMRNENLHAVVARSTFRSQNAQNTPGPDHFWKLRCRKSARRCGAKHFSKSSCTKHTILGPLLEIEMSKKCTPLWREAHFEVKMCKTHHARTTFGS